MGVIVMCSCLRFRCGTAVGPHRNVCLHHGWRVQRQRGRAIVRLSKIGDYLVDNFYVLRLSRLETEFKREVGRAAKLIPELGHGEQWGAMGVESPYGVSRRNTLKPCGQHSKKEREPSGQRGGC